MSSRTTPGIAPGAAWDERSDPGRRSPGTRPYSTLVVLDRLPGGRDELARATALLGQPGLEVRVRLDVEQSSQEVGAGGVVGPEEGRELALGEEHHPVELVEVHPQDLTDQVTGLVLVVGCLLYTSPSPRD